MKIEYALALIALFLCGAASWTGWQTWPWQAAEPEPAPVTAVPPTPTTAPIASPTPLPPTLADFWHGRAEFVLDIADTGLPMGESETLIQPDGTLWSYVHASDRSAGVVDQCGDPVEFPGCMVIYRSEDAGQSFAPPNPAVCQIACTQCPCQPDIDHINQQQYPRVQISDTGLHLLVYEYQGRTVLRRSTDGLQWGNPEHVAYSGLWQKASGCRPEEWIGVHPFTPFGADECLAGGPPGIFIEGEMVYVFVGLGQNPGSMGCFHGRVTDHGDAFRPCANNPLFTGARTYGPADLTGAESHPFWDFRMSSSAEIIKLDDQYYMLYEGIRGPGPNDPGDTQFGLGLARTTTGQLDGHWEVYPLNPILVDLPGNIGLGHADLILH
ncbi:MAG: hypothetical protein KDD89_01885, partial [Anaerolineales bacterium]|nr:hypothetical protein [Anaerolineales bacterium]